MGECTTVQISIRSKAVKVLIFRAALSLSTSAAIKFYTDGNNKTLMDINFDIDRAPAKQ